mmetsp:Transcript_38210/g.92927  ORF Transcript_38210/g.92927 Transcript_38210/m.92927 type:complete len:444 (-) Transcript_38210:1000-2331(-)
MTSPTPSPFHGYGSRRRGTTTRMYCVMMIAVFVLGESFQLPLAAVESFSFHQHHQNHHLQSSPSLLVQQQQQHRPMMILVQSLNTAVEESENKEDSTSHRGDSSSLQTSSRPKKLSTSSLIKKIARKALMATFIVSLVSFGPVVKAAWASSTASTASLAAATTAAVGATANIPVAAATLAPIAASTAAPGAVTAAKTAIAAASCPVSAMTEIRLSLRLLYAALLGAALGKERSFAKHSAGVRTMALVSMGAAAFTVCSSYGFASFIEVGCRYDPSRMAANVISGVGFVGAGVITTSARNNENIVHGLTTAATIWLSAAVGVACGVGLSRIATTAAITTLSILRLGRKKKRNEDRHHHTSHEHNTTSSTSSTKLQVLTTTRDKVEEMNNMRSYDGVINDHDVNEAEIHLTSEWDENNQEEEEEEEQQHRQRYYSIDCCIRWTWY